LPSLSRAASAVHVKHQFRVPELLRDDRRGLHRGFFIAGKFQDDVPLRLESLALELDERRDGERVIELHVAGAAPEQHAVFDHRSEWVALPVGWIGLDDVHVAGNHQRLELRVAPRPARDHVGRVLNGCDGDVALGKSLGEQRGLEQGGDLRRLIAGTANRAQRDGALRKIDRLLFGERMIRGGLQGSRRGKQNDAAQPIAYEFSLP
jgi:hypothetical protein